MSLEWRFLHHKYVDTPADPHSPRVYGFWYAHVAWIFDPKNDKTDLSNVRDLARLAHMWGSRRYDTPDTSRNNPLLALLTFGEGWHNNHHFYMSSARQGFRFWELDVSYYTLLLLSGFRIVRDVRKPPAWVLEGHARASDAGGPSRVGARTDDDRIDEAGEGSFPASDSPPWTLGSNGRG